MAGKQDAPSIRQRLQSNQITAQQAIVELVREFPSLSGLPLDATTWDADQLDRLAGKLS